MWSKPGQRDPFMTLPYSAAMALKRCIPYLALAVVESLAKNEEERAKYVDNYLHAIMKGLNKIMARMGISTYMSYIGAQIFEAVGLKRASSISTSPIRRVQWKGSISLMSPEKP